MPGEEGADFERAVRGVAPAKMSDGALLWTAECQSDTFVKEVQSLPGCPAREEKAEHYFTS